MFKDFYGGFNKNELLSAAHARPFKRMLSMRYIIFSKC
jgi:hypothetical protein